MRLLAGLFLAIAGAAPLATQEASQLTWSELPPLPDTPGLGGPFVGVTAGALVVAGGANFPDGVPWEGGRKVWYADVLVLEPGDEDWSQAGRLPRLLAYGASVSLPQGVAILGGSDSEEHHADCYVLAWDPKGRDLERIELPSLPAPTAFPAAALLGDVIYLAAGSPGPDPTRTTHALSTLR